jgi:hypothetical protein
VTRTAVWLRRASRYAVLGVLLAAMNAAAAVAAAAPAGGRGSSAGDRAPLRATFAGVAVEVYPGYVRVSEALHLRNGSKQPYVGEVHVGLPRGALFVTFHNGWHRPVLDGDRLRDRLTVPPGEYRLTYSYSVSGAGAVDLGRRVTVPIDRLETFTLAPAEVRGPALTSHPPSVAGGRVFNRSSARAVGAGTLALQAINVPHAQRWPAPAAAAALAAVLGVGLLIAVGRARRSARHA